MKSSISNLRLIVPILKICLGEMTSAAVDTEITIVETEIVHLKREIEELKDQRDRAIRDRDQAIEKFENYKGVWSDY